jgi:hypothetical protein
MDKRASIADISRKLDAIRTAAHNYAVGDIYRMLAEIETAYGTNVVPDSSHPDLAEG